MIMFRKKFSLFLATVDSMHYYKNGFYRVYFDAARINDCFPLVEYWDIGLHETALNKLKYLRSKYKKFHLIFEGKNPIGFSVINESFGPIFFPGVSDQIISEFLGVK